MVDPSRLAALLARVGEERRALRRLAELGDDVIFDAPDRLAAMKYRFVVAAEALIDAGQHVIASEGWVPPASFADVFARLAEHGVVDPDLGRRLQDLARFRNLLVHQYADVDDRRVVEIARTRLDDLSDAAAALARLV